MHRVGGNEEVRHEGLPRSASLAVVARRILGRPMRFTLLRRGRSTALSAALAAAGLATAGSVLADHCAPEMPAHPRDARGFTFTARVVRMEGVDTSVTPTITFAVEQVYAGAGRDSLEAGRDLAVVAGGCGGIEILGMAVGDEVLVSSSTLTDGPSTFNSAVWRITGGRLRLLTFGGMEVWPTSDRRLQRADTLREALALVAPGVVVPPDTATAATATPGAERGPALPAFALIGLASLLASVAWLTNRHTRATRASASQFSVDRPAEGSVSPRRLILRDIRLRTDPDRF